MEVKFTPWRMAYIGGPKATGCVFCAAAAATDDAAFYVVARGRYCFVILNAFPYNNGHVMVLPYEHTADLVALDPEAAQELMDMTRAAVDALRRSMHPTGYNIGMNLGEAAGAGIADHLHMHVVPRWNGDTNFMSVVGDTRLIPQALEETWRVLREAWGRVTTLTE
jgi:ATP adenylyltransferase